MDMFKFILVFTLWCATNIQANQQVILNNSIDEWCSKQCPFQNKSSEVTDGECGSLQCYIGQCSLGCRAWKLARETSCQDACNGTQDLLPPRALYCVMGCNYALNRYFEQLRDEIGPLPVPALVADTLTATSLSLDWSGGESQIKGLVHPLYRLQWRYEDVQPGADWQYYRNHSWSPATAAKLDNLQPYTNYRFRVAALVSRHPAAAHLVIFSLPSVVVGTLSEGLPASPPSRVRAAAVDHSRVSVSWEPAPFPHGPVLSYVLHLSEVPVTHAQSAFSAVKDLSAKAGSSYYSYMFQNVPPSRNFTLSVATRNWQGAGPAAMTSVSTPPQPQVHEEQEAILLLGTRDSVLRQSSDMFLAEPTTIYNSPHQILGVAVHVHRNLLFVADSSGSIRRMSLEGPLSERVIVDSRVLGLAPRALSVDWLHELLYVVGEAQDRNWRVLRCTLDGQGVTVAVAGFQSQPRHLQVDPYNGYLFWVLEGRRGGLYRLDLAEVSNGVRHETRPELILEHPWLGAFTVDHANFRLLVADHANNTVLAVSLDGKEVSNIRSNTQKPMFDKVLSLATANGLFFWTNGTKVLGEDYHPAQHSYYHFIYPQLEVSSLFSVMVLVPAAQPTPVPVNPPSGLQAVLGHMTAKLSWQAPHLLGGQGKGAWQNWSYEVQLRDEDHGTIETHDGVSSTSLALASLLPDTQYALKACAYTSAGRGPWSAEFRGRSFRAPLPGFREPSLVWGATEGLVLTDTTGQRVDTLIHADSLKDGSGPVYVSGVAWHDDILFLATNASRTLWYNLTSREQGVVTGVDSAGSIAVDWLGNRLYWSNPKQQLITRGSLKGEEQEPLPILTVAKELHIDSRNAFLYWSTGHAVECARLNGQHRHTYYPAQLFSGKQVMGVTLEPEQNLLFWIVRSYEGSLLFQASMALDSSPLPLPGAVINIQPEKITSLMHPVVQGPLCYYSDHLLWIQDSNNAVISDMSGQSAAVISGPGLTGLNMVAVIDPARHILQPGGDRVNVVPENVRQRSIRLVGSWDAFNVTWPPVTNVNFGKVFYEVKIWEPKTQNEIVLETDKTSIEYPKAMPPYSQLDVSVRAFTYWGSAPISRSPPFRIRTPSAPPSAPVSPRAYVSFAKPSPLADDNDIRVQFRWDVPASPNGVVEGYRVRVCLDASDDECEEFDIDGTKLELDVNKLYSFSTYSFQVWARTSAGESPGSDLTWVDTSTESPVPRLLVGNRETLSVTDCDRLISPATPQMVTTVIRGEPLSTVAFLAADQRLFWLSQDRMDLYSCLLDGSSVSKVVSLNGTGQSLAVDWVARTLYWSEIEPSTGSAIWRVDLQQSKISLVSVRAGPVTSIQVSPLSSSLYWVELDSQGNGKLMTSQVDGSKAKPFFSLNKSCSCPENPLVTDALSLDATQEKLFWSDARHGNIMAANLDGCFCQLVINASAYSGLPAMALTIDRDLVYWSGGGDGRVYSAPIGSRQFSGSGGGEVAALVSPDVSALPLTGVRFLTAVGSHLQPFPEPECLKGNGGEELSLVLLSRSPHSLKLELPEEGPRDEDLCKGVSLPNPNYHLYYAPRQSCDKTTQTSEPNECGPENLQKCAHLETYDKEVELRNLSPYTCYRVMLAIGNFYTDRSRSPPILVTKPELFLTQAGAPSEARNVSVKLLSPWSVHVNWVPPDELRGPSVRYEVLWSTGDSEQEARQRGEQPVIPHPTLPGDVMSASLDKLLPAQNYLIWVRAYSEGSAQEFSDSAKVSVHTLSEPRDIELLRSTPHTLNISWQQDIDALNIKSRLQVLQVSGSPLDGTWHDVKETMPGSGIYVVGNLTPKTLYQFRVSLHYPSALQPFRWPPDNRFTYETLGDIPSAPGTPHIQYLRGNVYQVSWEASRDHGAPIEMYLLEGRAGQARTTRSSREAPLTTPLPSDENQWKMLYNGTETYWIISDELISSVKYSFRVCARNSYGMSAWSSASEAFDLSEAQELGDQPSLGLVLATALPVLILACVFLLGIYICRQRRAEEKSLQVTMSVQRPDVELATLREVPRGRGGIPLMQHINAIYTGGSSGSSPVQGGNDLLTPTDQEVAALPHIRRDQITLTKFLGSGAFGEVFEGSARQLPGGQHKVAVKTLRKGATEQEKAEFLKEAQLMSNFRHAHILQLLGVCLDNDPNFIIMELMEGGDLLSHLRTSRPLVSSGVLTLVDLVAMCVDVARGCRYLEEMHFVHRDLACRNCLVSFEEETRVVKIGDFGLARDIYKNDYYRKEGEGLLPVRWMAPESLMDGVFTSQSDAWAFGVLVWEILTLGQQPYPARTNLEVLHFVRGGGRLTRPANCPDAINQLMLKCWSYCPEGRPTFKHCLEVLEVLQREVEADPNPASIVGHYIGHTSDRPVKSDDVFDESLLAVTVSLPPEVEATPNYLEVIVGDNGYETPRQLPAWTPHRPRALSAGHQEVPAARRVTRGASVEPLLVKTVPYSNIASSQPLLRGDDVSDSSGISSQLESVNSADMCVS